MTISFPTTASVSFDADGYTMLDVFVDGLGRQYATELRLTDDEGQTVSRTMDADVFRDRFTFDIDGTKHYTLSVDNATVPYLYLAGGPDILDRGIRVLDLTMGSIVAGDGASETPLPARAAVHYEPPEHWMNDPNGLCRFQGRYHMYYQFNPYGWDWDNMHWGHAVSRDLVHWTHLPVFLTPQRELHGNRTLSGGAFSGSAIPIDAEGRPCPGDEASAIRFFLTRHRAEPGSTVEYQTTFTSTDSLTHTEEKTVITLPNSRLSFEFRDPKVEAGFPGEGAMIMLGTNVPVEDAPKEGEPGVSTAFEGGWHTTKPHGKTVAPGPDKTRVPAIVTYANTTPELRDDAWEYRGAVLCETGYTMGYTFECPDMFPLDGKDVAVGGIMHVRSRYGAYQPIRWYIGDLKDGKLDVENSGWCDFGDCYYAAQSFRDDQGRRIAFGWLADWSGVRREAPARANGAMSLPRELHVRDGKLYSKPVAEVYDNLLGDMIAVDAGGSAIVPGNAYYLDLHPSLGMSVRLMSFEDSGWTLEVGDHTVMCRSYGMECDDVECVAEVASVNRVEVFYDRGIIEVFVNDGEAAGTMLAFDPRETGSVTVLGDGKAELRTLRR